MEEQSLQEISSQKNSNKSKHMTCANSFLFCKFNFNFINWTFFPKRDHLIYFLHSFLTIFGCLVFFTRKLLFLKFQKFFFFIRIKFQKLRPYISFYRPLLLSCNMFSNLVFWSFCLYILSFLLKIIAHLRPFHIDASLTVVLEQT